MQASVAAQSPVARTCARNHWRQPSGGRDACCVGCVSLLLLLMPPKKGQDAAAAKAAAAKKAKALEDKTFGLKNKNKSAKVQKCVSGRACLPCS